MPVRPRARAARPAAWRAARREQLTTRCSTSTPARAAASGTAAAAANGCAATRARITGPASRAPAHDGGGQGGDGGDGSSGLEGSDGAGGGELHVTGLYLLSVGMNDTIPETLSALTRLESLVLSWNAALTGKLPRALFSSMPSLTTVQLDGTGFRGRLPPLGGAAGGCAALETFSAARAKLQFRLADFTACGALARLTLSHVRTCRAPAAAHTGHARVAATMASLNANLSAQTWTQVCINCKMLRCYTPTAAAAAAADADAAAAVPAAPAIVEE